MLHKFFSVWETFDRLIAGLCFFFMSLFVVSDVILREAFQYSAPSFQKWAVVLMIWSGFMGAILTTSRGGHLRPEIADKLWGARLQPWIDRVSQLMIAGFCGFMAYIAIQYVLQTREYGDVHVILQLPMWCVQAAIPYTFLAMCVRHLAMAVFPDLTPAAPGRVA